MLRSAATALILAIPAFAQPPGPARSYADLAAPFVDEHTLVYVRADVSRLEVETFLKLASVLGNKDVVGEVSPTVRKWVAEFLRKGGREIFLTYGPGDYPHAPALIVPIPESPATRNDLGEMVAMLFREVGKEPVIAHAHGCVVVGTREAQAIVRERKPVARPDLAAAIAAGRDTPIQIAIALSDEAKKIHEQVAPTLPAELGGGGVQKVTRGMKWSAITVGAGPKLPTKWIVEAASPLAAQDLKGLESKSREFVLAAMLKELGDGGPERKQLEEFVGRHTLTVEGIRLTAEWELATAMLAAVKSPEGPPAERHRSANNLKQLMLAVHSFHDANDRFPNDIVDKDGKPLLSWRVQILPYIEHDALYREFKLDEPWDSRHNKPLAARMPKVFKSPRQADTLMDRTTYLAPLGKGFLWDAPKGLKITQISDGTANTIALVEGDDERAVIWTKPEDMTIDLKNPRTGLLGHYGEGFHVAMADGSVRLVRKSISPEMLLGFFTRAGGEIVEFPK